MGSGVPDQSKQQLLSHKQVQEHPNAAHDGSPEASVSSPSEAKARAPGKAIPLGRAAAFGAVTKGFVGIPIGAGLMWRKESQEKKQGKPINRKKDILEAVAVGAAGIPIGAGVSTGGAALYNARRTRLMRAANAKTEGLKESSNLGTKGE